VIRYSEAAERNKEPIRQVLADWLPEHGQVLEIGSGTGQHAVYFARHFPYLRWIVSDLPKNHPGLVAAMSEASLPNLAGPISLDVSQRQWPSLQVQAVYTSNTCHIMAWENVLAMFGQVARLLPEGGRFLVYGPFNLDGEFTSQSNRVFDTALKHMGAQMGIRDLTMLQAHAREMGVILLDRKAMPANNMLLCWSRSNEHD
jgi:cyclopropane fatty-acyl-phospholipid synthase-like methyltransferase